MVAAGVFGPPIVGLLALLVVPHGPGVFSAPVVGVRMRMAAMNKKMKKEDETAAPRRM